MTDFKEVIISNHREFLFDLDVKRYLDIGASKYDKLALRMLNSNNRVHRMKFKEKIEVYLKDSKLSEKVARIYESRVTLDFSPLLFKFFLLLILNLSLSLGLKLFLLL